MDKDHEVNAAIQCNTFENDSMMAPPLCTIFSDHGVDTDPNTFSHSPLIDAAQRKEVWWWSLDCVETRDLYLKRNVTKKA
jgi:hypothetical protein